MTYESYLSTVTHDSADAPLTAREAEMAEIRAAEASTIDAAEASAHAARGQSLLFGPMTGLADRGDLPGEAAAVPADGSRREITGALPWTDQVADKVRQLGGESAPLGSCAVLVRPGPFRLSLFGCVRGTGALNTTASGFGFTQEIDVPNETVVLASEQPQTLTVPTASPCYLLYRHAAGLVLVYSCPPSSPVKSRLLYSSAVLIFCKRAVPEWTGLSILKKVRATPSLVRSETLLTQSAFPVGNF